MPFCLSMLFTVLQSLRCREIQRWHGKLAGRLNLASRPVVCPVLQAGPGRLTLCVIIAIRRLGGISCDMEVAVWTVQRQINVEEMETWPLFNGLPLYLGFP